MRLADLLEQELSWVVRTTKEQAGSERDQHGLETLSLTPALHPAWAVLGGAVPAMDLFPAFTLPGC